MTLSVIPQWIQWPGSSTERFLLPTCQKKSCQFPCLPQAQSFAVNLTHTYTYTQCCCAGLEGQRNLTTGQRNHRSRKRKVSRYTPSGSFHPPVRGMLSLALPFPFCLPTGATDPPFSLPLYFQPLDEFGLEVDQSNTGLLQSPELIQTSDVMHMLDERANVIADGQLLWAFRETNT